MDEHSFWKIVDDVHAEATPMPLKCEALTSCLAKLSAPAALSFREHFDRAMDRAFDYSLWGAAYVINGGCGDDTFADFRAALISRGQRFYLDALLNPDGLAPRESDLDDWFFEGYEYAVTNAVRTHLQPPPSSSSGGWLARLRPTRSTQIAPLPPRYAPHPQGPTGKRWTDDELPTLYPRLWARFA